jgi:hypothetical protein
MYNAEKESEMDEKRKQTITPRLDIELHKELKIHCVKNGLTIEEFTISAIKEKLEKEN